LHIKKNTFIFAENLKLNNMKNYIILITLCVVSFVWANWLPIIEENNMLLALLFFSFLSFSLLMILIVIDVINYIKKKDKENRTF
jgi:hypothetical protein